MIIERLNREHPNIEKLLAILERELEIFDRGDRPDFEVIHAIISYFKVYPEVYHHPQEDLVFAKLRIRDPAAAAKIGDLAREHQKGAERLRRVAQGVDSFLADREILRKHVDIIVRDFIEHERHHIILEDRDFFPAALKALEPQDWTEIASALSGHKDPLFSDVAEEGFDMLRAHILRLEQEAEVERELVDHSSALIRAPLSPTSPSTMAAKFPRHAGVVLDEAVLQLSRATHRVDDTAELDDRAVPVRLTMRP